MAYNELDGVAKGGVQEPSHGLSELHGDFFRGKGQDGGKGNDGEEVEGKDGGRIPAHGAGDDGQGHDEEEEVDIVCGPVRVSRGRAREEARGGKRTAEKRHLCDVPGMGQASEGQGVAVAAGCVVAVEEEGVGDGAAAGVVGGGGVGGRLAIDKRRALVGAAVGLEAHLASLLAKAEAGCRAAG